MLVSNVVHNNLHTLCNDHYDKANNYTFPYKVITLLTIFLIWVLYLSDLFITYIAKVFYLFVPITYFATPPTPSFGPPSICSLYQLVCFHLVLLVLFFIFYI